MLIALLMNAIRFVLALAARMFLRALARNLLRMIVQLALGMLATLFATRAMQPAAVLPAPRTVRQRATSSRVRR